jgi:hypothetical protein
VKVDSPTGKNAVEDVTGVTVVGGGGAGLADAGGGVAECAVEAISASVNILALFAGGSWSSLSSGCDRVADVDPASKLATENSAEMPGVAPGIGFASSIETSSLPFIFPLMESDIFTSSSWLGGGGEVPGCVCIEFESKSNF